LIIEGEVAGSLVMTDPDCRHLKEQEEQILVNIANQASLALQNLVKLTDEKTRADTDGLTGLYNRRYFNEKLEESVYQAQNRETPLSIILFDVDNFKRYNDTYGHPAGDQLLKMVAKVMQQVVGDQGIVARYGGEEFVIILRRTDNSKAALIAEEVRRSIENLPGDCLKARITESAGVGTLPLNARDRVALTEYADQALYQAKHTGKNRVCCNF
jgi:diguanylate cyclase (GGDEF)-like protein